MNQSTTATATNQVGYLAPLRSLSSFAPPHRRRGVTRSPSVLHRRLIIIINPSQASLLVIIIALRRRAFTKRSPSKSYHHHQATSIIVALYFIFISCNPYSTQRGSSYFSNQFILLFLITFIHDPPRHHYTLNLEAIPNGQYPSRPPLEHQHTQADSAVFTLNKYACFMCPWLGACIACPGLFGHREGVYVVTRHAFE